jgi:hypothetical protein
VGSDLFRMRVELFCYSVTFLISTQNKFGLVFFLEQAIDANTVRV